MNITFDDPRLTAYALDELDGAGRAVIESEMQNFGECRREVEEITRAVALVHAGLASEPAPALLPVQQRAIEAKIRYSSFKPKLSWIPSTEKGRLNWPLKTALAVVVALLIGVVPVPVAVMHPALSFLQNASTDIGYAIMQMAGIPVIKHGSLLIVTYANQNQIVSFDGAGCAPFYSSLVLLVASLLVGDLYLRSPWKRLFLTLFVIPLVIVAEGLRIFTVAELCYLGAQTTIDSPILQHGSSIFFALSLIPFAFFLVWLRKLESKS
jgi:exosortase/archaeosortase family protein